MDYKEKYKKYKQKYLKLKNMVGGAQYNEQTEEEFERQIEEAIKKSLKEQNQKEKTDTKINSERRLVNLVPNTEINFFDYNSGIVKSNKGTGDCFYLSLIDAFEHDRQNIPVQYSETFTSFTPEKRNEIMEIIRNDIVKHYQTLIKEIKNDETKLKLLERYKKAKLDLKNLLYFYKDEHIQQVANMYNICIIVYSNPNDNSIRGRERGQKGLTRDIMNSDLANKNSWTLISPGTQLSCIDKKYIYILNTKKEDGPDHYEFMIPVNQKEKTLNIHETPMFQLSQNDLRTTERRKKDSKNMFGKDNRKASSSIMTTARKTDSILIQENENLTKENKELKRIIEDLNNQISTLQLLYNEK